MKTENCKLYYLAFSHFFGIGPIKLQALIRYFGSVKNAYNAKEKDLSLVIGHTLTKKFFHFKNIFDEALKSLNSDYEAKRYNNITLDAPEIIVARQGLFYDWLAAKNKLGGQHKVPRLSNNRDNIEEMLKFL